MKKYLTLAASLSLSLASLAQGCTERTADDQPDAYVPPSMPDAAMSGDASMDARATSDGAVAHDTGSCTTMNLHSNIGPSVATGSTASATDRHTPASSCASSGSPDVWFSWTAPAGGGMFIATTVGSSFDTVLDVLTGCTGTSLACDDDGGSDLTSTAIFTVAAGQSVVIIVDGSGGSSGDFILGIQHYTAEICTDHIDNDGDGYIDCADSDCAGAPGCIETLCHDGIDNDGDGDIDCLDSDCSSDPTCHETDCSDGIDNDGDGDIDCADSDCAGGPGCFEAVCNDGIDDDHDGYIDCEDTDCDGDPACVEAGHCADHEDNDRDDAVDCADSDCAGDPACPAAETNCNNGIDDDDDDAIDCSDSDCASVCAENTVALCMNGMDDDADMLIDCADRQCSCTTACPPAIAPSTTCPDVDIASAVGRGVYHGRITPYACGARSDASCTPTGGAGGEIEIAWTAPTAGFYVFDTNDTSNAGGTFDTVLTVRDDCSAPELDCNDNDGTGDLSEIFMDVTAGQMVVFVVDAVNVWDGGNVTLNIRRLF